MSRIPGLARAAGVAAAILSLNATAVTVHDESVNGDLNDSRAAPTLLVVQAGSNDFFGVTTGNGGIDLDYAKFLVPAGHVFSGLTVLPGTNPSGGVSFIGLQAGSEITVNPAAPTSTPLLGWLHYGTHNIGLNILPEMGTEAGSIAFTASLQAGTYSLWIQDFGPTLAPYGFRIEITPVPEAQTYAMVGAGLGLIGLLRQRRRTGR